MPNSIHYQVRTLSWTDTHKPGVVPSFRISQLLAQLLEQERGALKVALIVTTEPVFGQTHKRQLSKNTRINAETVQVTPKQRLHGRRYDPFLPKKEGLDRAEVEQVE